MPKRIVTLCAVLLERRISALARIPSKRPLRTKKRASKIIPPKALEPSAQRPWPRSGDRYETTTFQAVGRALSAWEKMEAFLALIFSFLVTVDLDRNNVLSNKVGRIAGRRAYGSIRTFEGRHSMMKAAATTVFSHFNFLDLRDQYNKFFGEILKFSGERNKIAHAIVTSYIPEDSREEIKGKGFVLIPPWTNTSRRDQSEYPTYAYSSKEINYFASEFTKLSLRASTLHSLLAHRLNRIQEERSSEQ